MATQELQAAAVRFNNLESIRVKACDIQHHAITVRELADAISEASDHIESANVPIVSRIVSFSALAMNTANSIADTGEEIETAISRLKEGPPEAWDRWSHSLDAYRDARSAQDAQHSAEVVPAQDAFDEARNRYGLMSAEAKKAGDAVDAPQDRFDELVDLTGVAMRKVMHTPAPDLAAAALKLEIAIEEDAFNATDVDALVKAILADLQRLDGAA